MNKNIIARQEGNTRLKNEPKAHIVLRGAYKKNNVFRCLSSKIMNYLLKIDFVRCLRFFRDNSDQMHPFILFSFSLQACEELEAKMKENKIIKIKWEKQGSNRYYGFIEGISTVPLFNHDF